MGDGGVEGRIMKEEGRGARDERGQRGGTEGCKLIKLWHDVNGLVSEGGFRRSKKKTETLSDVYTHRSTVR